MFTIRSTIYRFYFILRIKCLKKAVEEGRGIYANIKKTVWFLLSSNIGEVISMFVAVLIGLPSPLVAIQILWVNLITDSLPAIALGSDAKDKDIMKEQPRGGILHVTDIVVNEEDGQQGSGGFDPDVGDWGDVIDVPLPIN